MDFPCGSADKESACNVGDMGSISGLRRSLGGGNGYPLQYSGLENSMDCVVHGVTELDMTERLSLAFHSSTLAWKIPWMEEPGGLQSMGLLRVGHD